MLRFLQLKKTIINETIYLGEITCTNQVISRKPGQEKSFIDIVVSLKACFLSDAEKH